jgi:lipopolysaccharide/colanic/teichoic acid biosynthesis glycosyltransferase
VVLADASFDQTRSSFKLIVNPDPRLSARRNQISARDIRPALMAVDCLGLVAAFAAAFRVDGSPLTIAAAACALCFALAAVSTQRLLGAYAFRIQPATELSCAVGAILAGVGLTTLLAWPQSMRLLVLSASAFVVVALSVRLLVAAAMRIGVRRKWIGSRIVAIMPVVGRASLLRTLQHQREVPDVRFIDDIDDLDRHMPVDEVIFGPGLHPGWVNHAIKQIETSPLSVSTAVRIGESSNPSARVGAPARLHIATVQDHSQRGWAFAAKRTVDIVGAVLGLILLSPLLILVAVAIKAESPGPVIFRQERFGRGGRPFMILKFRSMRNETADPTGSRLTSRNDSRVTRVGRIIRATSIDELPQLVNVLLGQLSLVGPRPHPQGAKAGNVLYGDLIANFNARYRVMPGLTGLAQSVGLRGNTDTEDKLIDRFHMDMTYANGWSFWLDIRILFVTVYQLALRKNAF